MLNPWLLLGSIAFVAGFSINLLMNRNLGDAFTAGLTTLATAWSAAAAVNWYRNRAGDTRTAMLRQQIHTLQQHRAAEQEVVLELEAEQERIARSLSLMQGELQQRQLSETQPARDVSWNLATTGIVESASMYPAQDRAIASVSARNVEDDLRQFIAQATATKQKITASLNNLQVELSQLNAQASEHRQLRDQLFQEVNYLSQQKQTLTSEIEQLQADVKDLEQCRTELDHYIVYVETKKQELETGTNPLQKALQQLQTQVTALQIELQQLDSQVGDRRREKDALDREIAAVEQQKAIAIVAENNSSPPEVASLPGKLPEKNIASSPKPKKRISSPRSSSLEPKTESETLPEPTIPPTPKPALPQEKDDTDNLSEPWTNFMVQLSDYELQALRAIAQENNPLHTLNTIAEESFTNLDELLTSINRQAEDILGESVVNFRSGSASPAIVRDHQKQINKMIETYEYLTE